MEGRNEIERETRKWLEERKGEQKRAEVDRKKTRLEEMQVRMVI